MKLFGALASAFALAGCSGVNCDRTSVGTTPLSDLRGFYQGEPGGLYPGGSNAMPSSHLADGLTIARAIRPLDPDGIPSPNGRVVFISIGMSNTTQEFSTFASLAGANPARNRRLVIVDGAQDGVAATQWAEPSCPCWSRLNHRLADADVTPQQVVTAWIKVANGEPTQSFPRHARILRDDMAAIVRVAKQRYPNLRLAYVSSRIYAGYTTTTLNPEPYAYESAFAVRWVIEAQLAGRLNFDPARGPAIAPWVAWGPYLWSDGITPRGDGLTWACGDLRSDGTHPSESGRLKVANLLLSFLKSDPTARIWFGR